MNEFTLKNFKDKDLGKIEVLVGEGRILFPDITLRKLLDVKNTNIPYCATVSDKKTLWVDTFEVFEYIKYARVNEEKRFLFEEWLEEIIVMCAFTIYDDLQKRERKEKAEQLMEEYLKENKNCLGLYDKEGHIKCIKKIRGRKKDE